MSQRHEARNVNEQEQQKQQTPSQPPAPDAPGQPPAADGPVGNEADPQAMLARLQAERDELEARLLRTAADYQNYVRRSQQNLAADRQQQVFDMTRKLLTVLDHFDHAIAVDPKQTPAESLLQGVQMVRDELVKVLEGFGVTRFEAQPGETFDPQRHQALMRVADPNLKPGQVAQQFKAGYCLGEKTLRPAAVSVVEAMDGQESQSANNSEEQ